MTVIDGRPGLNLCRLEALMRAAIVRCRLNLSGQVILTEAASGAYMVTPVLAALAGAEQVFALTRTTQYGSSEEITEQTYALAQLVGVTDRVKVVTQKTPELVHQATIITNSGHVRPIDAAMVDWMRPEAVISLMYEAWEFRSSDIDLAACCRRYIPVAGTNEQHPAVNVFSFLGIMAVKQLLDTGVAVYLSRILLLCDNPFALYIKWGLIGAGAHVDCVQQLAQANPEVGYDAVLVAMRPSTLPAIGVNEACRIAEHMPGAVIVQYWGNIDREAVRTAGLSIWPLVAPVAGHMGVLPSSVGPEPIVRLQAGGLKVGEVLARGIDQVGADERAFVQLFDGEQAWQKCS